MSLNIEIVLPVLNEEDRLPNGLTETLAYLEKSTVENYTITIADNGSTDRTEEISRMFVNDNEHVHYIKLEERGVGRALKSAWINSTADIVGYMDVDLATDLNHLEEVQKLFQSQSVDVVNGSRLLKDSKVSGRTKLRTFTSKSFNLIVKILLGVNFSDGMCGFKFIRRELAQELINEGLSTPGWFFCTELLVKSEWKNKNIKEIAVKWTDDPNSKVKVVRLSLEYLKNIFRLMNEKRMV